MKDYSHVSALVGWAWPENITEHKGIQSYLFECTYSSILISMAYRLKLEVYSTRCCRKMFDVIDEKHGV